MSNGVNKWTGLGNVTRDAELKVLPNGNAVCNFSIACNSSYLDKDKQKQESVEFVSLVLWGKRGEVLAPMLTKGKKVYVEGALKTEKYEKGAETRYSTKVVVSEVVLLGGAASQVGDDAPRPARSYGGAKQAGTTYGPGAGEPGHAAAEDDDPIPF